MDIFGRAFKNKGIEAMIQRLFLVILCAVLGACASAAIQQVSLISPQSPRQLPRQIFVRPLAYYEPNVEVDRSGRKLSTFQFEFQEKFTRHLVQRLPGRVAPATAVAATAPLPRGNYWEISGQIDQVTQGSRLLRSLGGAPWGASELEVSLIVSDLSGPSPRPFLRIKTEAGSHVSLPLLGARDGLTFDVIRTSREVVAALSEYLYQRGLIPYEAAASPKRSSPRSL